MIAQEEAMNLNHDYIGTEHFLLGLLKEGQGIAAQVLREFGVEEEKVIEEIIQLIGKGENRQISEASFTPRSKKVLELASQEANQLKSNYIDTEHILLGLVREEEGVAVKVLVNLGVVLTKVRSAVEFIIGRGEKPPTGETGLTPRAKRVIELAIDEARNLGHNYIGTEHLLLGLLREGGGVAAAVLDNFGVTLEKARSEIDRRVPKQGSEVVTPVT